MSRSEDLNPTMVLVAETATTVESFIVDWREAGNFHLGDRDGPSFDYVELLGGMKGYYAIASGPTLSGVQLDKVKDMFLDKRNYTSEELCCVFDPSRALRFNSPNGSILVFLCAGCRMMRVKEESGARLDNCSISIKSAKRWEHFLEELFPAEN